VGRLKFSSATDFIMLDADKKKLKLQQKVLCQYCDGKISAGGCAEVLGISLREWYELLERKGIAVNWDECRRIETK
jgi:predicted HTH domain antitoxin